MKKLTLTLLFASFSLLAQPGPVSIRPDCFEFFTFTATGNSNVFDNRSAGCPYFSIAYSSNGFSAESIVVQTAPDAGGTPGSWSTYTANSGSNPNTATTQASSTFSGYFPWLRVQLTSKTGTGSIQGILYGWRTPGAVIAGGGTAGCAGTAGTPCVVDGPTAAGSPPTTAPVLVAGADSANLHTIRTDSLGGVASATLDVAVADGRGSTIRSASNGFNEFTYITYPFEFDSATGFWDRQFVCPSQARVTLSDGTRTQLVALSASTVIRVCQIHMTTTAPEDFTISYGTGSACGTGTTTIDKYLSQTGFTTDFQPTAALRTIASNALCVTQSGVQSAEVTVVYAQF